MADNGDQSLKWYSTREPVILLVLTTLTVLFFLAVSALSRIYHAQQEARGESWYQRGIADRQAGNLDRAISEFQAAELYSRGNFLYQLSLAETLAERGKIDEAYSYFSNLRERQPDNGTVSLGLARILAKKGDTNQAIRYYHNAIYSVWDSDPDQHRRAVRFELVDFLLRNNAKNQAESELIALAGNLPNDPALRTHVGDLFLEAQDYQHALEEFRDALRVDHHDAAALAGAGRAAYELAAYPSAKHYLQGAVAANPDDSASADLLKTVSLVLETDPFRRQLSASQRDRAVIDAFNAAGERLKDCPLPVTTTAQRSSTPTAEPPLDARWKAMKPQVTLQRLRHDPDFVNDAMDLVFTIEQQTSAQCGAPTGKDLALLLVSKLHEGSER